MKHFLIFLVFVQNGIFYFADAQVSDDFTDGDFDNSPTWLGDKAEFIVNTEGQLQLSAPAVTGTNMLVTQSEIIDDATWSFYIKLDFNPSSNNYIDIYLVSDKQNLDGPVNGYFVRIGNTQDEVSLYKQSGNKATSIKVIDGLDGRVNSSAVELYLQITKNVEHEWELLIDLDLSGSFISEGKVIDDNHYYSRYFGIYCNYSSTRADKFYFDELSISGDAYIDDLVPVLDSILVLSDSSIQVNFNEKILTPKAHDFFLSNGIGNPYQIAMLSDSSVILFSSNKLVEDEQY